MRQACALLALVAAASAQRVSVGETISIHDSHPLARAAAILRARYGVPISYDDLSEYDFNGDLADPVDVPKVLPIRSSSLTFFAEPMAISYSPVVPADQGAVARVLRGILEQHEKNGNPGRFKLIETPAGLYQLKEETAPVSLFQISLSSICGLAFRKWTPTPM